MGSHWGECGWRTFRSIWFGHQSWFDLGRCGLTVGDGITGFSLSDTSVRLLVVAADGWMFSTMLALAMRPVSRHRTGTVRGR
jgi:hypothetical protein